MTALEITLLTFCITIFTPVFIALNRKSIRVRACNKGKHYWPKSRYYCSYCSEGRGSLSVIDGQNKATDIFKS